MKKAFWLHRLLCALGVHACWCGTPGDPSRYCQGICVCEKRIHKVAKP